ncbi:MAG: hypothetical protein JJT96_13520 [Opitutales bacterium]|nr:hypothetical protein [Opitutales bacterium]
MMPLKHLPNFCQYSNVQNIKKVPSAFSILDSVSTQGAAAPDKLRDYTRNLRPTQIALFPGERAPLVSCLVGAPRATLIKFGSGLLDKEWQNLRPR